MRTLRRTAITLGVALMLLIGYAGPAHAYVRQQEGCSINGASVLLPTTCRSDFIEAHPTGYFVDFVVSPYAGCTLNFQIRDEVGGVIVAHGSTSTYRAGRVRGLHSWYRIQMQRVGRGCGGQGWIDNY